MSRRGSAAELAGALADPLRLSVLHRLLEGPATVSEFVAVTGESQPKVSNHLAVLRERALVVYERRGRQVLYRLADPAVANLVESLLALSGDQEPTKRPTEKLASARTCFDHLAGRLGVAVLDVLIAKHALVRADRDHGDLGLGRNAAKVFGVLGVDLAAAATGRRRLAYACLDWTEHRHHLGGAAGAALCAHFLTNALVTRLPGTRAVRVTQRGRRELAALLGIEA